MDDVSGGVAGLALRQPPGPFDVGWLGRHHAEHARENTVNRLAPFLSARPQPAGETPARHLCLIGRAHSNHPGEDTTPECAENGDAVQEREPDNRTDRGRPEQGRGRPVGPERVQRLGFSQRPRPSHHDHDICAPIGTGTQNIQHGTLT